MKDSHYRISLDIHSTQSQVSLPVKQGDTSRKVFISLCEGGKPYHIEEDCFAVFSAKKPDGNVIENNCVIADNVIEYSITEQTSSARGILNCEIKLYSVNYGLLTSPSFTIIVDGRAVSDAEIESSSDFSALTTVYNETNAIKTEIENKLANGEFDGEDVDYNLVANALKGTASGNPIRLDDVSPVEHEIAVSVSNKSAIVKRLGKNLFDISAVKTNQSSGVIQNGNGTITINVYSTTNGQKLKDLCPDLKVGDQIAFTIESSGAKFIYLLESSTQLQNGGKYLVTEDMLNSVVYFYNDPNDYDKSCIITNIQIEYGTTTTEPEPYKKPETYTPTENGTVTGVTSLCPTTTLLCDKEGVTIDVEYNRDANKVIAELLALILGSSRIAYIDLLSSKWQGAASPYSQVVSIPGATANSKIDLNPSIEQLEIFHQKDISFVAENEDGVVTVYCVGQKPTANYQMQITITEVLANG